MSRWAHWHGAFRNLLPLVVLVALGCSATEDDAIRECGAASPRERVSRAVGSGARAGPIWLIAGRRGERTALVELLPDYPRRIYPTKVLIFVKEPLSTPVEMTGFRCSDRRALRFWYGDEGKLLTPRGGASEELMSELGDTVATLRAGQPPTTFPALGYPGFILFSAPGKWSINVRQGESLVGAATILVVTGKAPRNTAASAITLSPVSGRVATEIPR